MEHFAVIGEMFLVNVKILIFMDIRAILVTEILG